MKILLNSEAKEGSSNGCAALTMVLASVTKSTSMQRVSVQRLALMDACGCKEWRQGRQRPPF